jgi:hypothetical protein
MLMNERSVIAMAEESSRGIGKNTIAKRKPPRDLTPIRFGVVFVARKIARGFRFRHSMGMN